MLGVPLRLPPELSTTVRPLEDQWKLRIEVLIVRDDADHTTLTKLLDSTPKLDSPGIRASPYFVTTTHRYPLTFTISLQVWISQAEPTILLYVSKVDG
jgi:hypothetical protein